MPRILTGLLLVLASTAQAGEAENAALMAAIEAAGCVVTVENGDAVTRAAGLNDQQVYDAVAALYDTGQVRLEADGSMRLITGACK